MLLKENRGFTLLEILVALFIFSVVSIILLHVLRTVFTAESSSEAHSLRLAELQFASLLISKDLEQTIERSYINNNGNEVTGFTGSENTIDFIHGGFVNPLGILSKSSLQHTRYSLNNDQLIRDTWDVLDQANTSTYHSRVLLNNVESLHLSYIDDQLHKNDKWPPASHNGSLPKAVRVNIKIKNWGTYSQLILLPGLTFETKLN